MQQKLDSLIRGRYQVTEFLGEGGYGRVFKVYDSTRGEDIAVKEPISLGNREELSKRFETMYRAQLDHPNIIKIYDVQRVGSINLLFMEFVNGVNLESLLKQYGGRLDEKKALCYTDRLCEALEQVHQIDTHKDVHPKNLLFTLNEEILKLTDFGLLKKKDIATSTAKGTIGYAAPEQRIPDPNAPDPKNPFHCPVEADLYSVGAVLYFMISGRGPFEDFLTESQVNEAKLNKNGSIDHLSSEYISKSVMLIIKKCLQPKPEQRYRSATALKKEIRRILDGQQPLIDLAIPIIQEVEKRIQLVRGYVSHKHHYGTSAFDDVVNIRDQRRYLENYLSQYSKELAGNKKVDSLVDGLDNLIQSKREQDYNVMLGFAVKHIYPPAEAEKRNMFRQLVSSEYWDFNENDDPDSGKLGHSQFWRNLLER
jgi:serine/threonine protein kinase